MAISSFWIGVQEVLHLLKEHSEKYKRQKQATTKLERLSGWAVFAGGVLFFAGGVVRQVGDLEMPLPYWGYVSLSIFGLAVFAVGAVVSVVEFFRATRPPFVEHIVRIDEAIERERELIAALEVFETATLEFARMRLQLESTKVSSRLGVMGGGDGVRTSLVGVAMLGVALISQYEPVAHGWTMKSLGLFGLALLLGLSIGGLLIRYGVSQADYYSGIIGLALQRKGYLAKKPRASFSRRAGLKEDREKGREPIRADSSIST